MRNLPNFAIKAYSHLTFAKVKMVRHQGTVIAIAEATDPKDNQSRLYYNILDLNQQGVSKEETQAEKKGENTRSSNQSNEQAWVDSHYWTGFQLLEFPTEVRLAGMNLLTFEVEEPGNKPGSWVIVSSGNMLYLFRSLQDGQISLEGKSVDNYDVYCNRYILFPTAKQGEESATLTLKLKQETRYRRSGLKDTPLNDVDSPGDSDMDDRPFVEPTLSFHQLLNPYQNNFAVCITPGHIPGRYRWQFICEQEEDSKINMYAISMLSSEDGWIDCADIVSQKFKPKDENGKYLYLVDSPNTLIFRPQEKATKEDGTQQTLPAAPRLLVAAPMSSHPFPSNVRNYTLELSKTARGEVKKDYSGVSKVVLERYLEDVASNSISYFVHVYDETGQLIFNRNKLEPSAPVKEKIEAAFNKDKVPQAEVKVFISMIIATFSQMTMFDFPLQTEGDGTPFIPNPDKNPWELSLPTITYAMGKISSSGTTWDFLSSQMGVLDWLPTSHSPKLIDSADGHIYLYTTDATGNLQTTRYDCTAYQRTVQTLGWYGFNNAKGAVNLIARQVGSQGNSITTTLRSDSNTTIALTIKSSDFTEEWTRLPGNVLSFMAVLNGEASNDLLDPAVQNGTKFFYDYEGGYQIFPIDVEATDGKNIYSRYFLAMKPKNQSAVPIITEITVSDCVDGAGKKHEDLCDYTVSYTMTENGQKKSNRLGFTLVPRKIAQFIKEVKNDFADQPSLPNVYDLGVFDIENYGYKTPIVSSGNVDNGSYKPESKQGYTMSWADDKDPQTLEHLKANGSAIFYAQTTPFPSSDWGPGLGTPAVGHTLTAKVLQQGQSGGWENDSALSALNLTQSSNVSATLNPSQSAGLIPAGDFSVEAWVNPTQLSRRQRIITATAGTNVSDNSFSLGINALNALVLSNESTTFSVNKAKFENQSFTLALWVKSEAIRYGKPLLEMSNERYQQTVGLYTDWWSVTTETQNGQVTNTASSQTPNFRSGVPYLYSPNWSFYVFTLDYKKKSGNEKTDSITIQSYKNGLPAAKPITVSCDDFKVYRLKLNGNNNAPVFVKSLGLLNRALADQEISNMHQASEISPKSIGLIALYTFSGKPRGKIDVDETFQNQVTSAKAKTDWKFRTSGDFTQFVQFSASTGVHYVQSKHDLSLENVWSHFTAVTHNNTALKFTADKETKAVNYQGEDLNPEEAFSLDTVIKLDSRNTNQCLLSNVDETGRGYTLGITSNGQLFLTVTLHNKKSGAIDKFTLSGGNAEINKQQVYYIAVGVKLDATAPPISFGKQGTDDDLKAIYQALSGNTKKTKITPFIHITNLSSAERNTYTDANWTSESTYADNKNLDGEWQFLHAEEGTAVYLGCQSPRHNHFDGEIGYLRFWERDISLDASQLSTSPAIPPGMTPPTIHWRFDQGEGKEVADVEGENKFTLDSVTMWCQSRLTSEFNLFVNGEQVESVPAHSESVGGYGATSDRLLLGSGESHQNTYTDHFVGSMRELRLWNTARSAEEIADNLFVSLYGNEKGLVGYWPLNDGSGEIAASKGGIAADFALSGASWLTTWSDLPAPPMGSDMPIVINSLTNLSSAWAAVGQNPVTAVEYGDLQTDEAGLLHGVMKRCYGYIGQGDNKCNLVTGFKVGDLAMHYIGQVQTRPQLHGYIEGAPPLPSENMTRPYWKSPTTYQAYIGASSVELIEADNTVRSYSADKNISLNAAFNFDFGPEVDASLEAGIGVYTLVFSASSRPFTIKTSTDFSLGHLTSAHVSNGSTKTINNRFDASGNWEPWDEKKLTEMQKALGRRYIPDNIGYALVKSRVANLYALRLGASGSLVGMSLLPDPDIPEDFNILIFPIEKTYTKQGTLDGKIGFFNDPSYPNADQERGSYFKPKEAYNLVAEIEAQEAALNAAYAEFKAQQKSLSLESADTAVGYGSADPAEWRKERKNRSMVNSYVWTAASGLYAEEEQTAVSRQEAAGGSFDNTTSLGIEGSTTISPGIFFDLSALYGLDLHSTVMKSKEEGRDFSLNVHVDAEGFLEKWEEESSAPNGINTPGKVTAYRFKTFYLAPEKNAFDTFFNEIVDHNWLKNSADPDAVALRAAKRRPNQVWRVLHRVTFVSRIPPDANTSPVEDMASKSRSVVDITGNQALIDELAPLVDKADKSYTIGQRIGSAIHDYLYLANKLKDKCPLWKRLVESGANDDKLTAQKLERAVYTYMSSLGMDGLNDNQSTKRDTWHEEEGGES